MPIPIIAGIVIVIVAAVGFVLSRNGDVADIESSVEQSLPTNGGPEPISGTAEDEGGEGANPDSSASLPMPVMDGDGPAVSEMVVEENSGTDVASLYVDGTYTADASYFTPRNTKHDIAVSLTLADNVVVAADVSYDGGDPKNGNHERFEAAFAAEVIGVALDDVSLSRTGGASLTSEAFNEAVASIKQSAAS